jgi:hypothetical protein
MQAQSMGLLFNAVTDAVSRDEIFLAETYEF